MSHAILVVHAFATIALVGLIWTIQLVHYPLMALVGREGFAAYEVAHLRRITPLVGPLMIVELLTAIALCRTGAVDVAAWMPWVGLVLVAVVWLATAFVSVPCHRALAGGFDEAALRRLVDTNWIRTVAWTLRGGLALALFG